MNGFLIRQDLTNVGQSITIPLCSQSNLLIVNQQIRLKNVIHTNLSRAWAWSPKLNTKHQLNMKLNSLVSGAENSRSAQSIELFLHQPTDQYQGFPVYQPLSGPGPQVEHQPPIEHESER
jgi:hypothetical protein